jgi:hypothetical protein
MVAEGWRGPDGSSALVPCFPALAPMLSMFTAQLRASETWTSDAIAFRFLNKIKNLLRDGRGWSGMVGFAPVKKT